MDAKSFRTRFCERFNVPDSEFEPRALRLFLHWPWSFLAPMLTRIHPGAFATDRQIIHQLGLVTSSSNFVAEVRGIRGDYQRNQDLGILRKWCRLRLSSERIFRASKNIWEPRHE